MSNKLGYHVNDFTSDAGYALGQGIPRIVKTLWAPDFHTVQRWQEARQAFRGEDVVVIYRYYQPVDNLDNWDAKVDETLRKVAPAYGATPRLYAEMPLNEGFMTGDELKRYAEAQVRVLPKFLNAGIKPALFNLSVGWPRLPESDGAQGEADIQVVADAMREAVKVGGILSLHEYGLPHNVFDTWLNGRYRRVWNHLRSRGVYCNIVITETGIDWRLVEDTFHGWNYKGYTADRYASEFLQTLVDRYAEDPYLIGGTTYCLDANDPMWKQTYAIVGYDQLLQTHLQRKDGPQPWWADGPDAHLNVPGFSAVSTPQNLTSTPAPAPAPAPKPAVASEDTIRRAAKGPGMRKAEAILGYLGPYEYHVGPQGEHTCYASNRNGWAAWNSETNEMVVYNSRTGTLLRDGGNHPLKPDGGLVAVSLHRAAGVSN